MSGKQRLPSHRLQRGCCFGLIPVFRYLSGRDYVYIIVAFLCSLYNATAIVIFLTLFGFAIGNIVSDYSDFVKYVYYMIPVTVLAALAAGAFHFFTNLVANRQVRAYKKDFFESISRQDQGFFDSSEDGELVTAMEHNCELLLNGITTSTMNILSLTVVSIVAYGIALILRYQQALMTSFGLPFVFLGIGASTVYGTRALKKHTAASSCVSDFTTETFLYFRTVVAFGLEHLRLNQLLEYAKTAAYYYGIYGLAVGVGSGVTLCAIVLGMVVGLRSATSYINALIRQNQTYGNDPTYAMIAFLLVIFVMICIAVVISPINDYLNAVSASNELVRIINLKSKIDPLCLEGRTNTRCQGEIYFKHVTFAYPTRPAIKILHNFTLKIPAKESFALVGPSGCGKSSIVQLILRCYDVQEGCIYLDNHPLQSYQVQWLREQVAIVQQEPALFNSSIMENIRYGRKDATDLEVIEAAKLANAYGFIMQFPAQFDTIVGDAGKQVSGGQKQRIAIARALVRKPRILILDEATSALDTQSEETIQETLRELSASTSYTTIVIAHRLSTVRHCARICVLGLVETTDGMHLQIIEEGTHEELAKIPDGYYASALQAENEERLKIAKTSSLISPIVSKDRKPSQVEPLQLRKSSLGSTHSGHKLKSIISSVVGGLRSAASFYSEEHKEENQRQRLARQLLAAEADHLTRAPPVSLNRPLSLLFKDKLLAVVSIVSTILLGASYPAIAFSAAYTFGELVYEFGGKNKETATLMYLSALGVAAGLLLAIKTISVNRQEIKMAYTLQTRGFNELLYKEVEFFDHPDHSVSTFVSILTSGVEDIKNASISNVFGCLQIVSLLVMGIGFAFYAEASISWRALLILGINIPLVFVQRYFSGIRQNLAQEARTRSFDSLLETIRNNRIVTAYNLQNARKQLFQLHLDNQFRYLVHRDMIDGVITGLSRFIQLSTCAYCTLYLRRFGESAMSDFNWAMGAAGSIFITAQCVTWTLQCFTSATRGRESASRLYFLLDRPSRLDVRAASGLQLEVTTMKPEIRFEKVSFFYRVRPDVQVFRDLNLVVKTNESLALVGQSGCGKSTIIQLLERFYDLETAVGATDTTISGGRITFNGIDIRKIDVRFLRSIIGIVSQEPNLFDTTIEENIRFGKLDATFEEIVEAAKKANAHDFIMQFSGQYQTVVGRYGGQLSGGQKQRIAIARAIIRQPAILILDEATSALDPVSERAVQQTIEQVMAKAEHQHVTFMIAHRLSTVRHATNIAVLSRANPETGAVVVELGSHQMLMHIPDGLYRSMIRAAAS